MDPARVPENIQKQARAKTQLLSFFGDNSYGWFDLDCMEPFEANFAARSKQNPKSQKGKVSKQLSWHMHVRGACFTQL
jgi:hypothetical protein